MTDPDWPAPAPRQVAPAPAQVASPTGRGAGRTALAGGWERLHPLSAVVRIGRAALALVVVLALSVVNSSKGDGTNDEVRAAILGVALILGLISWLVTRWRVEDGVLQIETGLLRRSSGRYPLGQVQAIDIVRPGLARVLGMAELRLRMGAGRGSSGRLAYLSLTSATELQARLLAMAHGVDAGTPAPPERVLYRVDPRRLVASLLISGPSVTVALALVGLLVLAIVAPGAAGAALASGGTGLLAALSALWQRFNGEYRLVVAEAPDGLRLRAGLIETSAETIPRGRVQALRLVQPLTWRPFGWCRVEVDLAGRSTGGRQNRAAKRAGRALVPVGTRSQAEALIERIMPGRPTEQHRPPARARWKAPLRYRHLSYARNGRYAATSSGRLRLVADWVPLAKVQSVRRVEGPLQHRMGLANVHLDTAGRAIFAVARDREAAEADRLMAELPEACREARALEPSRHPAW